MNSKTFFQVLSESGIAVVPTDTLYGLVGRALSKNAVERIYKTKGRDENKPFIILISSIDDLKKFGINTALIRANKRILNNVWPGPVSVIFSCPLKKFEYLHRGTKSIAFRFPSDKKLLSILKRTGPLVAPSVNPQGKTPAENITQAKKYFGKTVDFYLSGKKMSGKPSTVISLLNKKPEIIRQGKVKITL